MEKWHKGGTWEFRVAFYVDSDNGVMETFACSCCSLNRQIAVRHFSARKMTKEMHETSPSRLSRFELYPFTREQAMKSVNGV
jgi:hypothetical protein